MDWLHGGAESLLTVTNLLLVVGLRRGIREAEAANKAAAGGGAGGADAAAGDAEGTAAAAAKGRASR